MLLAVPAVVPRLVDRQQAVARIVTTVRGVLPVPLATGGALPAALVAMMATTDRLAVLVRPEQVGPRVRPAPVARRVAIDSMLEVPQTVQPGPTVAHARTVPAGRCAVHRHEATASSVAIVPSVANDLPGVTGRIAPPEARTPVVTDRNGRAAIVPRGIATTATIGRHVAAAGPVAVRPVVRRVPVRVVGQVVRCDRAVMRRGRPVPDVS
ncbi:MAG: hypothetical protein NTZ21_20815 [Actinobacteria bacterium]|nr:hypothetical protein [Actinomycetota bacterium]